MKKLNKKSLIPFILFIFLCILIYSKYGIIEVKAEEFHMQDSNVSNLIYYWDTTGQSTTIQYNTFYKTPFYFYPDTLNSNKTQVVSTTLTTRNSFNTSLFDTYYFKVLIHAKYFYDIKKEENFTITKSIESGKYTFGLPYQNFSFDFVDSTIKTSFYDDNTITYDEFVLFEVSFSSTVLDGINFSSNRSFEFRTSTYNNLEFYIPKTDNRSYFEIYDFVYSDEEITTLSLLDISSYDNITYYNPNELKFEEEPDNSVFGYIKRIWNRIIEVGRGILTFPEVILNYISTGISTFGTWIFNNLSSLISSGINSLFIPREGFLQERFTYNFNLLKNQLGFLFTPFELIGEILDKYQDLGNSNGIIPIPEIKDPIYNKTLIQAQNWDLGNIFTSNNTLNTIHTLYLSAIDVFLVVWLVNMFLRKFNSVFSGDGEKE